MILNQTSNLDRTDKKKKKKAANWVEDKCEKQIVSLLLIGCCDADERTFFC